MSRGLSWRSARPSQCMTISGHCHPECASRAIAGRRGVVQDVAQVQHVSSRCHWNGRRYCRSVSTGNCMIWAIVGRGQRITSSTPTWYAPQRRSPADASPASPAGSSCSDSASCGVLRVPAAPTTCGSAPASSALMRGQEPVIPDVPHLARRARRGHVRDDRASYTETRFPAWRARRGPCRDDRAGYTETRSPAWRARRGQRETENESASLKLRWGAAALA